MKRRSLFGLLIGTLSALVLPAAGSPERIVKKPRKRDVILAWRNHDGHRIFYAYMGDVSPYRKAIRREPPKVRVEFLRVPEGLHPAPDMKAMKNRIMAIFGPDEIDGSFLAGRAERLRYLCKWWELAHAYGTRGISKVPDAALAPGRRAVAVCHEGGVANFFPLEIFNAIRSGRQIGKTASNYVAQTGNTLPGS